MKLVPSLKWFHNWIGFVISITMLIVLSTGVYLGAMDMLKRADNKGQQYVALSTERKAEITAAIFEQYPDMSSVRFPTEYTPYIHASARGKTIAFDHQLNEIDTRLVSEIPMYSTIFWLHRNFLMADFGKYLNAWASLLGAAVTLVGIYLWWRVRKGFRLKQSIPSNTKSSSLLKSHIQLGLFISVPLFILCLSGFLITYKGLWTGALQHTPDPQVQLPQSQPNNWHAQLASAQALWPDSEIVAVNKPRQRRGAKPAETLDYSVRFDEHSGVWLRQADSITIRYETGTMLSALKHSDRPLSGKIASFVRPLHDALNMPFSYVLFITSVSAVGCIILLFTALTFYRRTFAKTTIKAKSQPA
ncbi:PepSY domain-containing protein [Shewanella sp. Scap07]|uniref:PepSY-associated TM helix domain-containing protein n=1 Tax=Shewanella sp. Scap07 TaxID=2589987 RepID=UPI0015B804CA|nr:PepSY-associated TM helix domain-containing protein [Shewanella sp. Scap07]QLE86566.1 PepSY domain-containing protein [Shewanella sp. Scap07]